MRRAWPGHRACVSFSTTDDAFRLSEFVWWPYLSAYIAAATTTVPGDLRFSLSSRFLSTRPYPTHSSQIHLTFAVIICVYFVLFVIRRRQRRRRRRLFFNSFVVWRCAENENFYFTFVSRCRWCVCSSSLLIGRFDDIGNESNHTTLLHRSTHCFHFVVFCVLLFWWLSSFISHADVFFFHIVLFFCHCSSLSKRVQLNDEGNRQWKTKCHKMPNKTFQLFSMALL